MVLIVFLSLGPNERDIKVLLFPLKVSVKSSVPQMFVFFVNFCLEVARVLVHFSCRYYFVAYVMDGTRDWRIN